MRLGPADMDLIWDLFVGMQRYVERLEAGLEVLSEKLYQAEMDDIDDWVGYLTVEEWDKELEAQRREIDGQRALNLWDDEAAPPADEAAKPTLPTFGRRF